MKELKHGHVIKSEKETYFIIKLGVDNLAAFNFKPISAIKNYKIIAYKEIDINLTIQDTVEEKNVLKIIHSNAIGMNNIR